jgi:Sec7-like guanine-nucleotide exchange factor
MFVRDHLLKIKDLAKSNVSVQNACSATLDFITKHLAGKESRRPYKEPLQLSFEKSPFVASRDLVEQEWDFVVDTLLDTFQVACSSANPRVIENALEALLTLVEKNMILGPLRSGKIGELLAKCYEVKDDSVHMSILLTFGMLVAKPACELHDANLMTAIRISYNIFLITSNTGIQKMAKEKLTEILRTLFQRMDGGSSASAGSHSRTTSLMTAGESSSRPNTPLRLAPVPRASDSKPSPGKPTASDTPSQSTPTPSTDATTEGSDDDIETSANSSEAIATGPNPDEKGPVEPNGEDTPKDDLSITNFGLDDGTLASATPTPLSTNRSSVDDIAFKDCLQAFRGLCKLSVKTMPEAQAQNIHSFDIRSRILCLELLNAIFEEDNLATFRNNSRFVNLAIKKQLMDTIYVNIPSPISLVFRLTLSICVALVKEFRETLKGEVEGILSCVMLPILESPNAPAQYRLAVIRALYVIYKSPQCITDLFLNYDCDLNGKNIFEQITKTVARAAQRKLPDHLAPEVLDQETLIKHLALKTSVCVTIALVEWSKSLYEHPADQKIRREKEAALKSNSAVAGQEPAHPEVGEFMRQKEYKTALDEGKETFKGSFKKGIRYFWQHGMCEKSVGAIARFLYATPGLDKTMIGEYLGERYDFDDHSPIAMLSEYAQLFNFVGLEIDLALRVYLGAFRLPGEGQKVSRIMEAFAKKYYEDTVETGHFGDSDAVYYLSMAITMLTTSIHNPSVAVADKLTLQSWKKLLLGQNAEKDYDDNMIDGIFARIAAEEFKVRGEDPPAASPSAQANFTDKQKIHFFLQEAKSMSEKTKELVKDKQTAALAFVREVRLASASSSSSNLVTTSESQTHQEGLANSLIMSSDSTSPFSGTPAYPSTSSPSNTGAYSAENHPLYFAKATSPYIADLMVRATGLSLLSTYQTSFESTNDLKTVAMCLEGLRGGIRLSCLFNLALERDAFIGALAQFTLLEQSPAKEMKAKHIEAISALITVTEEEGNLGECWKRVLACISPLEKLLATPQQTSKPSGNANQNGNSQNGDDDNGNNAEELNAAFVSSKIRAISIDRIFTNSSRLSDEAVVDFVAALCQVSKSELLAPALSNQTRTFSLQKLVEVADFNISRPKLVWMNMWNSVAVHFTEAGLHRASHVALVAVDSLRQVASKLIEKHTKESSEGGEFQVALLAPFEAMYVNPNPDIRDYLLCCLAKLMATHYKSVHMGWPAILSVINKASTDTPSLVALGIHQLESIKAGYFDSLVQAEHFPAYVESIAKYAINPQISEKVASQAIALLKFSAEQLATAKLPLPSLLVALESEIPPADVEIHPPPGSSPEIRFTARPAHRGQWFPVLRGLTQTCESHDINVRPLALLALFELLNTYGNLFSQRLFKCIFTEIIFPVFENVLRPAASQIAIDDTEWLLTTCHKFLHGTVVLFSNFYKSLGSLLLDEFLDLLSRLTLQNNEKLATFGITCLETLLTSTSHHYTSEMWSAVISAIALIMKQNMPPKLRVVSPPTTASANANVVPTDATQTSTSPDNLRSPSSPSIAASQSPAGLPKPTAARVTRQGTAGGLSRSTSMAKRTADPRKKILLGKAWIQNSALKMVRECLIDGNSPNETINSLEPRFMAQILDIYMQSFVYAYKVLRDPKLEDKTEQSLYDLILKQEIDSMWTYTEVVFALYNEHFAKSPASNPVVQIVEERILTTFATLEQCHSAMAQQSATLSERSRRLHESNEALVISFLSNINSFPDETFLLFLARIYPSFIRLTLSDSIKVRETVRDVMGRLGLLKLVGLTKESIAAASSPAVDLVEVSDEAILSPPSSPRASPRNQRKSETAQAPIAQETSLEDSAAISAADSSNPVAIAETPTSAPVTPSGPSPAPTTSSTTLEELSEPIPTPPADPAEPTETTQEADLITEPTSEPSPAPSTTPSASSDPESTE